MADLHARYLLGLDLGLKSGFAVWDAARREVLRSGVIDVRAVEDERDRIGRWLDDVGNVLAGGVDAVAYEQVRHMRGQGARYVLMQEGALLGTCYAQDLLCAGVNLNTLRKWVRDQDGGAPVRDASAMRDRLRARDIEVGTLDEAVAVCCALWLDARVNRRP